MNTQLDHHLHPPVDQTENKDGSGRESDRFRAFRRVATRSTSAHCPGERPKEKGPEIIRALQFGGGAATRAKLG